MTITHYRITTVRVIDGQTVAGDREVHGDRLPGELQYEASQPGTIIHLEVVARDHSTRTGTQPEPGRAQPAKERER